LFAIHCPHPAATNTVLNSCPACSLFVQGGLFLFKNLLKAKNLSNTKVLAVSALFAAISIVCGKFLAFNVGDTLRFSFENLPIIIISIFFGPLSGMLCGVVADLLGCLLRGYAINPILTLASAYIGFSAGIYFQIFKNINNYVRNYVTLFLCHFIGSVLIKTFGLCLWYGSPFVITLLQRAINYQIVLLLEFAVLVMLLKSKLFTSQLQKISRYNNEL
jgi:ECF transporter S component (folate family)